MSHFNESSTAVTMLEDQDHDMNTNENNLTHPRIPEEEINTNADAIDDGEFTTPQRDASAERLSVKGNFFILFVPNLSISIDRGLNNYL